jgi:hypothetical protein
MYVSTNEKSNNKKNFLFNIVELLSMKKITLKRPIMLQFFQSSIENFECEKDLGTTAKWQQINFL